MHNASTSPELPGFMQLQFAFAAAVRDPRQAKALEGVATHRLAIYQELVFNNIEEFLSNAFPVLRRISRDEQWLELVRDFIVEYRAATPLFPEMPREFLEYLAHTRVPRSHDYPFLQELVHYEWMELAVAISDALIDECGIDKEGSLLSGIPLLSPLARLCSYRFRVHRIGPAYLPEQPAALPTHLLIYRNQEERVNFIELNPVSAQLIQRIAEARAINGETLLQEIAREIAHPNPLTVIEGGLQLLEALRKRGIILGIRK